jgi:predicted enzyme related to lactoylglutathione lyase
MANQQLQAKLIACNVPTKDSAAARKFYNTLFGGQDFARSLTDKQECYFRPISQEGVHLTIATRQDNREPITCFFAVDNLEETVRQLVAVGGKVVVSSSPMPVSGSQQAVKAFQASGTAGQPAATTMGNFATMLDPDGNYLGLMQVDNSMQAQFNARPAQRMLSKAQVDLLDNWKQQGEPKM